MLNSKFSHVIVPGTLDPAAVRMRQRGPLLLEEADAGRNIFLLRLVEPVPPILEDIRELDVPFHELNIAAMECLSRAASTFFAIPGVIGTDGAVKIARRMTLVGRNVLRSRV